MWLLSHFYADTCLKCKKCSACIFFLEFFYIFMYTACMYVRAKIDSKSNSNTKENQFYWE